MPRASSRPRVRKSGWTKPTVKQVAETVKTTPVYKAARKATNAKELKDALATQTIPSLLGLAYKAAENKKLVIGMTGLNLLPKESRDTVVQGQAIGDMTSSMSMYMYRPPRKTRAGFEGIKYAQKTMTTKEIGITSNVQGLFDVPILCAKPVANNAVSDEKYNNLSIKRAFDQYLKTDIKVGTTYKNMRIQQTSIHITSLTNEFIITNNKTTSTYVDIFELVPQHNLGPSEYNSKIKADGYMSPMWCFQQMADNTISTDDNISDASIAFNPYNSTDFSRTWKEVKRVRVNLTGNATHRHKSVYQINKTVTYQEMQQFSDSGGMFGGWNPVLFCVVKGTPGDNLGNKRARESNISFVSNMQLNYEANPESQAKVIVFDDAL